MQSVADIVRAMHASDDPDDEPLVIVNEFGERETIHPVIARWWCVVLERRARDRAEWLALHNRPDDCPICHNCGGYGRSHIAGQACFCKAGEQVLKAEQRRESDRTHWLIVQEQDKRRERAEERRQQTERMEQR